MQEFFFANYRLLIDDGIVAQQDMRYIDAFRNPMPFTHTFEVHIGDTSKLNLLYDESVKCPLVCETELFRLHALNDGWAIARPQGERNPKTLVISSADYSKLTAYVVKDSFYFENAGKYIEGGLSFKSCIRPLCEAGMVIRDGLSLHASMVERDGYGIVFLGRSGVGKSTQAKLWEKYFGADFVIGDRPGFHLIDGAWYGYGMPWDGSDQIMKQKTVPIKAVVSLEQAKENSIRRLNNMEAMQILLKQAMMPMWDDAAMKKLTVLMKRMADDLPFYHLKNRADEESVELTYNKIFNNKF